MSSRDDGWQGRYRVIDTTPLEEKVVDSDNRHYVAKAISERNKRDRIAAQTKTVTKVVTVKGVKKRVQVKVVPPGYAEGVFFGQWVKFDGETMIHPKGGW